MAAGVSDGGGRRAGWQGGGVPIAGGGHKKARARAGDRIAKSPRNGGLCVRL
jgi:hypothetical protein